MDYVVCTRKIKKGEFISEPGKTMFLEVPSTAKITKPEFENRSRAAWTSAVLKEASATSPATGDTGTNTPTGDILVFIHGYNNNIEDMLAAHRKLKKSLHSAGYPVAVVSFDWPSAKSAINYLEDRSDARATASCLLDDCISMLTAYQINGCTANVHVLAHSTGAFVVREAFDYADDNTKMRNYGWTVSQMAFISGDISSGSMSAGNSTTDSINRHCVRITNFFNPYDAILKLSNMKRLGAAPRVGRVGLPADAPSKCVNVDCGERYNKAHRIKDNALGLLSHSWYIGDKIFTEDLIHTLKGNMDRSVIPTRVSKGSAGFGLKPE